MLAFRDATLDDAEFAADVWTSAHPFAVDPVDTRYWWSQPQRTYLSRYFIVERDGSRIGVGEIEHPNWELVPERFASVGAETLPQFRETGVLDAIMSELERRVVAEGATRLAARANEDDELKIGMLRSRGYAEDRRGRRWSLDLVANRERIGRMTAESRDRMRREGIAILTLDRDRDPDKHRKIWRMNEEAVQDVPTTLPQLNETLEEFMTWCRAPSMHEDRIWIAREGDDIVGLSALEYPPVRGTVGTAWTGTARRVRGRGIARALKCETLTQAVGLGVTLVRTSNDGANDPILHINASMGYAPATGRIDFLKDA
ncbi:MAG TPA: GNAT family N-acetyltransferase [Candidatus Acidoferrales bacterium]|nr:GNAT family N-acetyltransferase [Candidatus Acidoferrales bacterium]